MNCSTQISIKINNNARAENLILFLLRAITTDLILKWGIISVTHWYKKEMAFNEIKWFFL